MLKPLKYQHSKSHIKYLVFFKKYIVNSLKYNYMNAMEEYKNTKTKVVNRIFYI